MTILGIVTIMLGDDRTSVISSVHCLGFTLSFSSVFFAEAFEFSYI